MNYKLIKETNPSFTALQQILYNRNIPQEEWEHYMNTTDKDINSPLLLGQGKLVAAAAELIRAINNNYNTVIIVDSDCDGFTSAAIFINYLFDFFPTWIQNNLKIIIHTGKQHGLKDCIDDILNSKNNYKLVIVPDAGTNDTEEHQKLSEAGIEVIVLDHHELENYTFTNNPYATIINNQIGDYPNKFLSGAGVIWQFCRYLDDLMDASNADMYLDLVALGLSADMMSLTSIETKHLINKGLEDINNPFFEYMVEKNSYSLGSKITSFGIAFYVAPYVNAIVRSGTQEEKELLFNSMLRYKAFEQIPSTKRGHKLGEMEPLVVQAVRTAVNVKNRQTRAQDAGMILLEGQIETNHMLDNKVLLFLLEPGQIDSNIAGLVANKIMAKYQRPVCILTKHDNCYQGSARGCDKVNVTNFKDICEQTGEVDWVVG